MALSTSNLRAAVMPSGNEWGFYDQFNGMSAADAANNPNLAPVYLTNTESYNPFTGASNAATPVEYGSRDLYGSLGELGGDTRGRVFNAQTGTLVDRGLQETSQWGNLNAFLGLAGLGLGATALAGGGAAGAGAAAAGSGVPSVGAGTAGWGLGGQAIGGSGAAQGLGLGAAAGGGALNAIGGSSSALGSLAGLGSVGQGLGRAALGLAGIHAALGGQLGAKVGADTSKSDAAAAASAQLGRDALNWFQGEYQNTIKPNQQRLEAAAQAGNKIAMDRAGAFSADADMSRGQYANEFRPVDSAIASEALKYNGNQEAERMAQLANAETNTAFANSQGMLAREFARRGNVGSASEQAILGQMAMQRAAQAAGNMNNARTVADQMGWQKKLAASQVGQQIAQRGITQGQAAGQMANLGVGMMDAAAAGATRGVQLGNQAYGTALQGQTAAGSLYAQGQGQRLQADVTNAQNQQAQLGAIAGMMSGLWR